MRNITLQEYATMKKSSVEDIVAYWKGHGLVLDGGAAHVLTPSELKILDPILLFNLRKEEKRAPQKHTENVSTIIKEPLKQEPIVGQEKSGASPSSTNEGPRRGMKLAKAGKYFDKDWNDIISYLNSIGLPLEFDPKVRLTDEQYDSLVAHYGKPRKPLLSPFDDVLLAHNSSGEYIGGVVFFGAHDNNYVEYGYLCTNQLFAQKWKRTSLRFVRALVQGASPGDDNLVIFSPDTNGNVARVELITPNSQVNWRCVLRYIRENSSIEVIRRNEKPNTTITDIVANVIRLTKAKGLISDILSILSDSQSDQYRIAAFLDEYLTMPCIYQAIKKQLLAENHPYEGVSVILIDKVVEIALGENDLEVYWELKQKYPQIPYPSKMTDSFRCAAFVKLKDVSLLSEFDDVEKKAELVADALRKISNDEQYQLIGMLDETLKRDVLMHHMQDTPAYQLYLSEQWNNIKADLPYVVFDLESDGESISQFCFKQKDNIRPYEGETQLSSLGRAIKKQPIVVGHYIRIWDLPILEKKGIHTDSFVWDTLEMEILLNPCRYAYSLHTEHNAEADTELTDKLFWNQLFRLAKNPALCEELRGFLPPQIDSILMEINKPEFASLFEDEGNDETQFFQELIEPSQSLIDELERINEIEERVLIIAPRSLWARIAQYVRVAFPSHENELGLMAINNNAIQASPDFGTMKKCILNRFVQLSKTPIVGNIAQYLRIEKRDEKNYNNLVQISDSVLSEYTIPASSNIDCIDIDAFDDFAILSTKYQHIYIIGSELQDRTHKCQLGQPFSFPDLLSLHSRLPFSMASVNYCTVDDVELRKLGIEKPSLTANVWAERNEDGQFVVYHNYEYQIYRKNFLSHFSVSPEYIPWEFDEEEINTKNIICYDTDKRAKFDSSVYRLTPSTTVRAKYWTYQLALLQKIHVEHKHLPIVYVVNSRNEIDALTDYARSLGFYIPTEGTNFRKLEYINSHPDGMIIIDKDQFLDGIGNYRTDYALCYVWDNMDVERYQLMWRKLPFENDVVDNEEHSNEQSIGSTPKQCILAEWPIFEHYYSLIAANNRDSKFCVIEPMLEDCSEIAGLVKCSWKDYPVWESREKYIESVDHAMPFFKDESITENQIETGSAMKIIKDTFLGVNKDWYDYQKDILPLILQKESDYIVSIPTGGGKSILFQGPAIYRAAFSHKLSLVITPLRALMQDQVEKLHAQGFYTNVDYLSGDKLYSETRQIYRRIASGEIALLYVTPERFRVRTFINVLLQRMEMDHGLEYVIYDEAHCISQWGQDFRPDYRNVLQKCVELKKTFPFTMAFFSATITAQVENDLHAQVGTLKRVGQSPDDYNPVRSHIGINFELCRHEDIARVESIAQFIIKNNIDFNKSRMLVFCRTHQQCEETATELENIFSTRDNPVLSSCAGHVTYFHAGLDAEQRNDVFEQFKSNKEDRFYILCATKAFGMGMDIPNIHYVVHFNPPSVLEDYLQEVGRAGRDEKMFHAAFSPGSQIPALCLASKEDFAKLKDLLIKSLITWSDLRNARSSAIDFINRFQSVEQTKSHSIVLPYSFWRKNDNISSIDDTTSAKLALYWLEYIGYIKQGYIGQACLDVTIQKKELITRSAGIFGGTSTMRLSNTASQVFEYMKQHIEYLNTPTLLSIVDIRNITHFSIPQIFDAIIECQKQGLITLNDNMRCALRARRSLETRYMIDKDKNISALHIVMEGLRSVLADCKEGRERVFSASEMESICNHLLDDIEFKTIEVIKESKKGKKEKMIYMPWYEYVRGAIPIGTVIKAETFRKNIFTRAGYRMFSIMDYIPGVKCRTEKVGDSVCKIITVYNQDWKDFLQQVEQDCYKWLEYILRRGDSFAWAEALIHLAFDVSSNRGFLYFEGILDILRMLSYLDFTPLMQTGVEIYTTDTTVNKWDSGDAPQSPYHEYKEEFMEQDRLKKIRLAAMNVFSVVPHGKQGEYIKKYFLCRSYTEFLDLVGEYAPEGSPILSQLKEEALRKEEAKLNGNEQQKAIYEADSSEHINVLAGPGSGKTHVLTLRCAKLIYREAVDPRQILVLAYNRAVVAELKTRLNDLFVKLGMSRIAHQLNVYTFHAMAKKTMGQRLDDVLTDVWEDKFKDFLQSDSKLFKELYPDIRYIMIDEFQDITQTRLDVMLKIHALYPKAKFFTIGDINQSIYGFDRVPCDSYGDFHGTSEDYAKWLDPRPYYDQLTAKLAPLEKKMFTNYRSYQNILDAASVFLPKGDSMPTSAATLMEHEPQEQYVFITNNTESPRAWYEDLPEIIEKAKKENATQDPYRHIRNIAVFFRSNAEVYRGFSMIKKKAHINANDVRIRIQGASNCELWREREVYEIIQYLEKNANHVVTIYNDETRNELRTFIENVHTRYANWDAEYLDVTYTLILNFLDSVRADEEEHTWGEIAAYIMDIAGRDDGGQVYKIFEQYRSSQLWPDDRLTLILTTMHKVKGLEFDIVVITPSFTDLPLKLKRRYKPNEKGEVDVSSIIPNSADIADIKEERRLLFVAYTRAKKYLYVYKWNREYAIDEGQLFSMRSDERLLYTEKEDSLEKYNLSYTARQGIFDNVDNYIRTSVKKDDPVTVMGRRWPSGDQDYYIQHNGKTIGQLSSKSNIVKQANKNNITSLSGFFISDVCIWSYNETQLSDARKNKSYAGNWCPQAINQGYITIVQIAGFGEK